jgi:O-antigen ligase
MESLYNFFVLSHPFFPSPKFSLLPPEAVFAAIFGIYLLCRLPFRRARQSYPAQRTFIYLFVWLWAADLFSLIHIHSYDELRHVLGRMIFFIFIVMTYYTVTSPQKFLGTYRWLMRAVVLLAGFTAFCGFTNFDPFDLMSKNARSFWGVSTGIRRTQGVPISYGEYGVILNSILPVFIVSFWKRDFFIASRKWASIGLCILILGLFVSQSRNAWLATFMVFSFFSAYWVSKSPDPAFKGFAITGVLTFTMLMFLAFSDYFYFLYEGFVISPHSSTFYNRLLSDQIAFGLFLDNPFFGVGHASITQAIASVRGIDVVVHNGYMDQLAATGLFGFIPFISVVCLTIRNLMRMARTGPLFWRPWALCLTASFIANMSLLMGYKGFFSETFAIEYGLALSLIEIWEKEKVSDPVYQRSLPYILRPVQQPQ